MKLKSRQSWSWALSATLLASCPLLVHAADDGPATGPATGPYVGIEGGANWEKPQDQDVDKFVLDRLHYKSGWEAGVIGGYALDNGWRPELELSHRRNSFSTDLYGNAPGGRNQADAALANLWYDFRAPSGLFSVVHPYLGGGLGAVQFNNDTGAFLGADTNTRYVTELGYQAGAGVGFTLAPRLTLSVDYRHVWTRGGDFTINPFPALDSPLRISQHYLADTALISVRYFFGPAAPPPPAPEPPPPPPPPAPVTAPAPPPPPVAAAPICNPPAGFRVDANCRIIDQTFVVHGVDFELNSTKLTAPSAEALDQAAKAFIAEPQLKVEVQGFTDSTGPREYNLKLSQGRAESVRNYLLGKGVDSSALSAHGYGPDSPIASNATKEGRAQNRRVTFNIIAAPAHVKVTTEDASADSTEAAQHVDPDAKPAK